MLQGKFIKENIEILRLLESGGTANVYEAYDHWAQKKVAVKALYKSVYKDKFIRDKFKQEANIYLKLTHPNIVKLKDFISSSDTDFLVMEYVEGLTLSNYIMTVSGPLADEQISSIFIQIMFGFAHAHHNGIFHLDIKPSNIMIDSKGIVKILDFGISTLKDSKNNNGRLLGTPLYMSPEQVQKKETNRLSDIYSLGVTLFYAATANLPFDNISISELFNKIIEEKLPRIENYYPYANPQIQNIIDKATMKNPDSRYQTCEEFAYEIQNKL